MKLTQEQVDQIVSAAVPDAIAAFRDQLTKSIEWSVTETAREMVSNAVLEWVKQNIIPEITNELESSKSGLIQLGPRIAQEIIEQLAISASDTLKKRLEQSWERDKIFKALFTS